MMRHGPGTYHLTMWAKRISVTYLLALPPSLLLQLPNDNARLRSSRPIHHR
jgi:hypothetical protein